MLGVVFSQFPPQEDIGTITYLLDGLRTDGTLPKMMFVFCEGGRLNKGAPSFVVNSSFQGDVPGFCAKDVIEYINVNYWTLVTLVGRSLLGDTLTGDAVLWMAAAYPDVFSTVYINHPWVLA
jgi:enterochelin esterase-like enzyme